MITSCICGCKEYSEYRSACFHTSDSGKQEECDTQFVSCNQCGLIRQLEPPFDENGFRNYYETYPPTNANYKAKDWEHDVSLARQRCGAYAAIEKFTGRLLDVGSGSGAFVQVCRERGVEAFGCELSTYSYEESSDYIYRDALENINFPTDHFDWVTCHDVLEHSLNPIKMLAEMFRTTKQNGLCVIDFPRFHCVDGEHHWKDAEHIYLPDEERLSEWIRNAGFVIVDVVHPIESKIVVYAKKPEQLRKTVLVPPGIGDSYWSIVKMQSFLASEGIGLPEVIPVTNSQTTRYDQHERSVPFLQMFPFLYCDKSIVLSNKQHRRIWQDAYFRPSKTIWRDVIDNDYFITWNGHLRIGKTLEEVDPKIVCDWHPPMFESLEQINYGKQCSAEYDKYVACYFPFHGTYQHWTKQFPLNSVIEFLNAIANAGYLPVIVGAKWDADDGRMKDVLNRVPNHVNLSGQTSIHQVFGLLKNATAVVGYPSGLTIMSAVFRSKTLIIWNDYYNRQFAWNCVPPDVRRSSYFIDYTNQLSIRRLMLELDSLITVGTISESNFPLPAPNSKTRPGVRRVVNRPPPARYRVHSQKPKATPARPTNVSLEKRVVLCNDSIDGIPTVACVLKTGGPDYTADYVRRLYNMVARHTTIKYHFVCLTDDPDVEEICDTISLRGTLHGWWSKLELFVPDRIPSDYVVYFDLDTMIVRNIDDVLQLRRDFVGVRGWQGRPDQKDIDKFRSGIMIWRNDGTYSFLYDDFTGGNYKRGDQEYISKSLVKNDMSCEMLQDLVSGIYSYKRDCLRRVPKDVRIVCFHGRPRPHQILRNNWVKSNWR